jgi:hypothetical protein
MKVLLVMAAAAATVAAGTRLDADHAHATAPAGWKPLPEAARAVKEAMLGATTLVQGDALAQGDAGAGVFGVLAWVTSKRPVTRVRAELEGFTRGVRGSLEAGGGRVDRWEASETPTRVVVRLAAASSEAELTGLATAVVDARGVLHGYLLTCTRTGQARTRERVAARATAACAALLASFELSFADAELMTLEAK